MERIRLALVDDHTLFRSGLRGLLSRQEGFEVVADMGSGEEFLAALPTLAVDVVFMDISMPGIDGGETSRRALAMRPELRIITLSMYGDEQYYTRMMECGASGFLLKDSDIADVVAAVETVYAGDSYFSRTLLDSLAGRMHSVAVCEDEESLSAREIEILACVCQGCPTSRSPTASSYRSARSTSTAPTSSKRPDAAIRPIWWYMRSKTNSWRSDRHLVRDVRSFDIAGRNDIGCR